MADLVKQQCAPCRVGTAPLSEEMIYSLLMEIPEWRVVDDKGVACLSRVFHFNNFCQALAFSQQVGELAEAEQHHPQLITEWGKVTVKWWTHKIRGLHENDFIMAAKTSALLTER